MRKWNIQRIATTFRFSVYVTWWFSTRYLTESCQTSHYLSLTGHKSSSDMLSLTCIGFLGEENFDWNYGRKWIYDCKFFGHKAPENNTEGAVFEKVWIFFGKIVNIKTMKTEIRINRDLEAFSCSTENLFTYLQ